MFRVITTNNDALSIIQNNIVSEDEADRVAITVSLNHPELIYETQINQENSDEEDFLTISFYQNGVLRASFD